MQIGCLILLYEPCFSEEVDSFGGSVTRLALEFVDGADLSHEEMQSVDKTLYLVSPRLIDCDVTCRPADRLGVWR